MKLRSLKRGLIRGRKIINFAANILFPTGEKIAECYCDEFYFGANQQKSDLTFYINRLC